MINTERNRALLTDLFAALGREGWGEVFLAALPKTPTEIATPAPIRRQVSPTPHNNEAR
jgi:hypothetical protein